MKISTIGAAVFAAVVAMTSLVAHAQQPFLTTGPGGSLGISNGNGTYTYIYPDRLVPGANIAMPGTVTPVPNGTVYVDVNGQVRGNLIDSAGNIHAKFHNDGSLPPGASFVDPPSRPNPRSTYSPAPRPRPSYPARPAPAYAPTYRGWRGR